MKLEQKEMDEFKLILKPINIDFDSLSIADPKYIAAYDSANRFLRKNDINFKSINLDDPAHQHLLKLGLHSHQPSSWRTLAPQDQITMLKLIASHHEIENECASIKQFFTTVNKNLSSIGLAAISPLLGAIPTAVSTIGESFYFDYKEKKITFHDGITKDILQSLDPSIFESRENLNQIADLPLDRESIQYVLSKSNKLSQDEKKALETKIDKNYKELQAQVAQYQSALNNPYEEAQTEVNQTKAQTKAKKFVSKKPEHSFT